MNTNYYFSKKISSLQPSAIREILKFTADPTVISLAAGNPSNDAFPKEAVRKITADILRDNIVEALQYSVSEGYVPLVGELNKLTRSRYGVGTDDDRLIIVSGAQQGIEMSTKCLCDDGDTIICEDPSFIGSLNAFRSYDVNLVGVPMEKDGISIEKLEAALKENKRVRFIYLIPNFQNPSGITMSYEKRKAVYGLAQKYGALILEDNPYGDLRFTGGDIPSIKSLDTDGLVIYVGSFSKILSPGLRVGFVLANEAIIPKLVVAKQCSDVHTNILAQMICHRFITEYDLPAHIEMLRNLYRAKCRLMADEIDSRFPKSVKRTTPEGGLFLWCTLPDGSDMPGFCKLAVENKVAVVPGNAFSADEDAPNHSFRLNYSTPSEENIVKGIGILGELLGKM